MRLFEKFIFPALCLTTVLLAAALGNPHHWLTDLFIITGLVLALWFTWRYLAQLNELQNAVKRILSGNYELPAHRTSADACALIKAFASLKEDLTRCQGELINLRISIDEHAIVSASDTSGRIIFANDNFAETSKYSKEELIGQNHRIINSGYHPKEFFIEMWKEITAGRVWSGEMRNRAKDGSFYWVQGTIVPLLNSKGKPYQYLSIRTNITAAKHVQQELRVQLEENEKSRKIIEDINQELAHSNKELEAFAYVASHDLNAPLNRIKLSCELLVEEAGDSLSDSQKKLLTISMKGCQQMSQLIRDLLEYSRVGRSKMQLVEVDLAELASICLLNLETEAQARGVSISTETLPVVIGDRTTLLQLLQNLISNAIKFHKKDGGHVHIGAQRKDNYWEISVKDNGIGIAKKDQERIFKAFERLHNRSEFEGSGIGLATCKKVVLQHAGEIWLESELGEGTTVHMTLPAALVGAQSIRNQMSISNIISESNELS